MSVLLMSRATHLQCQQILMATAMWPHTSDILKRVVALRTALRTLDESDMTHVEILAVYILFINNDVVGAMSCKHFLYHYCLFYILCYVYSLMCTLVASLVVFCKLHWFVALCIKSFQLLFFFPSLLNSFSLPPFPTILPYVNLSGGLRCKLCTRTLFKTVMELL